MARRKKFFRSTFTRRQGTREIQAIGSILELTFALLYWSVWAVIKVVEISFEIIRSVGKRATIATLSQMDGMDGEQFENALAALFCQLGYSTEKTASTADYGADLIISKAGRRTVIQAKRWKTAVGVSAIQEVVSARAMYNARHAMVVTNSGFTDNAKTLAHANGVILIDRLRLIELVDQALKAQRATTEAVQPVTVKVLDN